VNKRTITWLLATLLAISANAAVPVVRVRTGSGDAAIVWIAQDRAEQRVLLPTRASVANARPAVPLNYEPPAQSRYFAASLYQRPPPSLR
jgi:2-keto-3-deoxy-L-rhamnonate aldolase RhmA